MILKVADIKHLQSGWCIVSLVGLSDEVMPQMSPGQFVEVAVDKANVLLNRPLSIFNRTDNMLELLVNPVGTATKALCDYRVGDTIRVVGPLGNGFSLDFAAGSKVVLAGGGVGIAPLYFLLSELIKRGVDVQTLYGMRSTPDREICERFEALAPLHICTDDGSAGFHGLITEHPVLSDGITHMQVCGPKPMMRACAALARQKGICCEVSLENAMACGLGACLCCVEDTPHGNVCVCKNGPVFNIDSLSWQ